MFRRAEQLAIKNGEPATCPDKRHNRAIADHFSSRASLWRDIYDDRRESTNKFQRYEMTGRRAAVLDLIAKYGGDRPLRILDAGSGPASVAEELFKRGYKVVCIDISHEMIREARQVSEKYAFDGTNCFQADLEELIFRDGSFDAVICIGVLQYLRNDHRAVGEIGRVLQRGGLAIVSLPNLFRINTILDPYYYLKRSLMYVWHMIMRRARASNGVRADDFGSNESFINRRYFFGQLYPLFRANDLTVVDTIPIGFGPPTFWGKAILSEGAFLRTNGFLNRLVQKRSLRWLMVFANRWVICLRKVQS